MKRYVWRSSWWTNAVKIKILIGCGFTTVTKEKHLVWEDGCFLFYLTSRVYFQPFFNRFAGMLLPFIVFERASS
jgi:hypothetical protein